ncbi:hypothetical protein DTO166G4_3525 [Paecilomyces variotii]|nr:hypothetical protein DTO166G4_3525 [Paecilomyces variotii]KAJ9238387.1 hypothetical protein DTO166G5_2935 [Paecilomyces variotii]KAJ9254961.1 hypothetical protein DTO195F2_6445 [Paecilomyces variotii]KAJ9353078.1 hypothetical protein DTO280E4_7506 [Paecilomyces variotii]KAJ9370155.1 hypothetical protein DTO282E5_5215 [Paecilomyces variotii]
MTRQPWQEVARIAQEARDKSIELVQPPVPDIPADLPLNVSGIPKQLLTPAEVEITETPPEVLVESLASGKLTSVEVVNAFLRRAGLAQKLVNCITELLPKEALERAEYLDNYLKEHKKPIGPLHGIPISVKEHVAMKGRGLNAGFVAWWDRVASEDAHALQILWKAGCVFYARTTEPQTLMQLACSSNLYGETVNGFNRQLTSGGSSGGEGALLGLNGSVLGLGTDIGGSIRSPAANNGVYGLRPTGGRFPFDGLAAARGAQGIPAVMGPMSTSRAGLRLLMKTALAAKPWLKETSLFPFPWRDQESYLQSDSGKKLKVAVIWDDGVVRPHPPVTRALKELADKLKNVSGVEVVDWKPYKHDYGWERIASLYYCDGAHDDYDILTDGGEPMLPLSEFIIKNNPYRKRLQMEDLWDLLQKNEEYRRAYAKQWNDTATGLDSDGNPVGMVDVLLCPVGPGAAPPINEAKYWGYTAQWNLLDYPAAVFPVTRVIPDVDTVESDYKPRNEKDEHNYKLYDPEVYRDAPVSLQLVARPFDDEKLLEALDYIHEQTDLPFLSRYT